MEATAHFLFELFKIAILASLYATAALVCTKIAGRFSTNGWWQKHASASGKTWVKSGFAISVLLFLYMFTYWGNHGLGDSARVPIGHFQAVSEINASNTYVEVAGEQYGIRKFSSDGHFLYAEFENGTQARSEDYLVWNLAEDTVQFLREEIYVEGIRRYRFPEPSTFRDFYSH